MATAVTGAEVPPELFERILSLYTTPLYRPPDGVGFVIAEKREMGNCALVCRYWASYCQRRMFRELELRSSEDVHQLLAFLNSPHSRVGDYICHVTVPAQVPMSPVGTSPSAPISQNQEHAILH